ncbi:MAG: hypothetical protein MUF85_03635 [Patescibacteria group bacterium]|nr:hypothetical protein [Patescibacteria group bacterium]
MREEQLDLRIKSFLNRKNNKLYRDRTANKGQSFVDSRCYIPLDVFINNGEKAIRKGNR